MNRVRFEGRLGRDPELRTTTTGKTLAKFSLVVRDARNESQNFFFDCTAWEPVASQVATTLKKNDLVAVDGRLTTNIYTNREGKSVKTYDIIAENVKTLSRSSVDDRKPQGYVSMDQMDPPAPRTAPRPAPVRAAPPQPPMPNRDNDAEFKREMDELFKKGSAAKDNPDDNIDWLKDLDDQ